MKKTIAAQPSEIQAELLEISGSTANYNQLMDNLQEQMSQVAKKQGKINLHLDIFALPAPTRQASPRKEGLARSSSRQLSGTAQSTPATSKKR